MSIATDRRVITADLAITPDSIVLSPELILDGEQMVSLRSRDVQSKTEPKNTVSVIIPGLINCHVHTNFPRNRNVEFQRGSMISWVQGAVAARVDRPISEQKRDVEHSIAMLKRSGVTAFAEISNDFASLDLIRESDLACRYFNEQLGFPQNITARDVPAETHANNNRVTIHTAPHAPYSTNPDLIRALVASETISSVHVAENQEEIELLQSGNGHWRDYLRQIGRDNPDWEIPNASPIEYLASLGILNSRLLLVHCVHVSDRDIETIAKSAASVVLCPNSNEFIGVGTAPVVKLFEAGVNLTLGTDSLASNHDLNLFSEMRAVKKLAKRLPYTEIWKMVTENAVKALGWEETSPALGVMTSLGASLVQVDGLSVDRLDSISREELLEAVINRGDRNLQPLAPAIVE